MSEVVTTPRRRGRPRKTVVTPDGKPVKIFREETPLTEEISAPCHIIISSVTPTPTPDATPHDRTEEFVYKTGIEPVKLALTNPHPRDARITFDEPRHIYFIDGDSTDIISVTTLIHRLFGEFDADQVITNMMRSRNWPTSPYFGKTREEIKAEWDANRDEASAAGTKMHFNIECFYNDIFNEDDSCEYRYFSNFWTAFQREYPGVRAFRTEWRVFDEDIRLAGSIDMVYQKSNGDLMIYDWKRCREIKRENRFQSGKGPVAHLPDTNYWHYALQLNTYRRILQKHYGFRVVELALVVLHPKNPDYVVVKLPFLEDEIDAIWEERAHHLTTGTSSTHH